MEKKDFPAKFSEASRPLTMTVWRHPVSENAKITHQRVNFTFNQKKALGLRTRYVEGKIIVAKASGQSKKIGIVADDEIIAVNGKDVQSVGQAKFIAALKNATRPLNMSVWREFCNDSLPTVVEEDEAAAMDPSIEMAAATSPNRAPSPTTCPDSAPAGTAAGYTTPKPATALKTAPTTALAPTTAPALSTSVNSETDTPGIESSPKVAKSLFSEDSTQPRE